MKANFMVNLYFVPFPRFLGVILFFSILLLGCAGKERPPRQLPATPTEKEAYIELTADQPVPKPGKEIEDLPSKGEDAGRSHESEDPDRILTVKESAAEKDATPVSRPSAMDQSKEKAQATARKAASTPPAIADARPVQDNQGEEDATKIVLNFDNADLYAVISTIADLLGINYIVDPAVQGKVTINTAGGLKKNELFNVFFQILEVNGLTAIREGSLYKILPLKDSPRQRLSFLPKDELTGHERTAIQIIPLEYMAAEEMTKLLTPFLSAGGTMISDTASNTLIVVDQGDNLLKILRLVEAFDVNLFDRIFYRFYPLKYVDAEDAVKILDEFTSSRKDVPQLTIRFVAISRINTLLAVSTTPLLFDRVEELLDMLDVVDEMVEPKIYVYFVRNGEAKDLASLLDAVFKKKDTQKKDDDTRKRAGGSATLDGNPFSVGRMEERRAEQEAEKAPAEAPPKDTPAPTTPAGEEGGAGTLRGDVHITPDEIRNALIIEATPMDYRIVKGILEVIDILPRQVLIEATIAEITRTAKDQLGMEWAFGAGAALGAASFAASVGGAGLKYSIGVTDKWYAALNALASKGKVNVLSSPHVLASDNKEAKIDVSREIPVASALTTYSTATAVTETSIQYRDTGVILKVTPHINEHGLVTMDISQEVSDLEKDSIDVAGRKYPAFFKRTVSTTLTVRDGQTLAIGGLIKDKEDESVSGVPCLIDIPVARYLFGSWSKDTEKVELVVLITPRVVADVDDVEAVTQEFRRKIPAVVKRFNP